MADEKPATEKPDAAADAPAILGYSYTHWDCEYCSEDNASEGDIAGEDVACTSCGKIHHIRQVM